VRVTMPRTAAHRRGLEASRKRMRKGNESTHWRTGKFIGKYKEIFNNPQIDFLKQQLAAANKQVAYSQKKLQEFKQKSRHFRP